MHSVKVHLDDSDPTHIFAASKTNRNPTSSPFSHGRISLVELSSTVDSALRKGEAKLEIERRRYENVDEIEERTGFGPKSKSMRVFEMHERYGDGEIWLLLETKSHSAAKKAKGTANAMLCALLEPLKSLTTKDKGVAPVPSNFPKAVRHSQLEREPL
ncbi:unnamed protein product [Sphenostylis stenocarpa]|uniref:Uncharacterized protein n=1 Tax=Sphenostylis stenocarpa TaxID=92480 RepID=A0AA86S5S1_9FABA|nr:unnamed protein product [Sphenostylis stenocarpa]